MFYKLVCSYDRPIEEPKRQDTIGPFIAELERNGVALQARLCTRFAREIELGSLDEFPGFPAQGLQEDRFGQSFDLVGAAAAEAFARRILVCHSGEAGAPSEYIVVTGSSWFYKTDGQAGPACDFHFWKAARDQNVAAPESHAGYVVSSFTEDGQTRHCAHGDLLGLRSERCHVRAFESHMCCKSCIFDEDCWTTDRDRLPCPR